MSAILGLAPATEQILHIARWAPSGDNAQPWQFQIVSPEIVNILVRYDTQNVYEYRQGEPTLISAGTLLENIAIAALKFGKKATWRYQGIHNHIYHIEVNLEEEVTAQEHPFLDQIEKRSVDRRPYKLKSLPTEVKSQLSATLSDECSVDWFQTLAARHQVASICRRATQIRLKIPETFEIHRRIIDWDTKLSPDAIPAGALGVDAATLKIMRWSLAKMSRAKVANAFGSAFFAGIQMDVLPGIFSAGYFSFRVRSRAEGTEEKIKQMLNVGRAVQRFWLAATGFGLVLQPCLATLAFAYYGKNEVSFTVNRGERISSRHLSERVARVLPEFPNVVFLGRIGYPTTKPTSRSVRLPLDSLMNGYSEKEHFT